MENEVQKLSLRIEHIIGEISKIKEQQRIFIGRFVSERGTEKRRHEGIDKEIEKVNKRITEELDKVDKKWDDIIFNRKDGIAFLLDRLNEKDKEREKQSKWIKGIGGGFILLALERIFSYLTHKN